MPNWLFLLFILASVAFITVDSPAYAILPLGVAIALNGQLAVKKNMEEMSKKIAADRVD